MSGAEVLPSLAQINKAGKVKIVPAASDSPAEPMVCTILFSRIEFLRSKMRITPIEITAAGIEADTVIPTRSPKYALAAPKTIANKTPITMEVTVISGVIFSAAT